MPTPIAVPDVLPNPLLEEWRTDYGLPPFDRIKPAHFPPAFDRAMREHLAQIDAIADDPAPPDFANTIAAFDASGQTLKRLGLLFYNLTASETSDALQAIERELAPRQAAHQNAVMQHARLFARIHAVYRHARETTADGGAEATEATEAAETEAHRLLARIHLDFVRAGALLPETDKARYAAIVEELATLTTRFAQNVLADEAAFALTLTTPDELAGLPDFVRDAARQAAEERGLPRTHHVITLSPSIAEPFLAFSTRRDLRETVWRARTSRGAHAGAHDNRPVAARIVQLRQAQAVLLGYANYADYQLADRMAANAEAVDTLLMRAWGPALEKADEDRARLHARALADGEPTPIAAWDWRYLAEKIRRDAFSIDDAEIKPYFTLDAMLGAMFDCAQRLFGLRFIERRGVTLHHPDARLWEVSDRDGAPVGVFIGDNFARPTKHSGAWMSSFRYQSGLNGGTLPIVINNNNFAKATPALLGFDDIRTLFHEFGHGLHGLLSKARYQRLAGTRVLADFVELPSQIFENWAMEREVLRKHARHVHTGEPIPDALLDKLQRASRFDQAFDTIQYVAPALIDMALHARTDAEPVDVAVFEAAQCTRLGVPADIGLRHALPHFQHLFASASYAAGYYVYMWAEVLEADGYAMFQEAGDPFDAQTAEALRRYVYSSGNTIDPALAYRAFRGREPEVMPMLVKRGLA